MLQLIKIAELSNFNFFKNFKWLEQGKCDIFGKVNIIYGWNGTGKSTLCDFFEIFGKKDDLPLQTTFKLMFRDSDNKQSDINHKSYKDYDLPIKVYNDTFIKSNIATYSKINHIFTVGEEHTSSLNIITRNKNEIDGCNKLKNEHERLLTNEKIKFEQFKTKQASNIKTNIFDNSYNKTKFEHDLQLIEENKTKKLNDSELQKLKLSIASKKILAILDPMNFTMIDVNIIQDINEILNRNPAYVVINRLRDDQELQAWVYKGLNVYKQSGQKACPFCEQSISSAILDKLNNHFNMEYTKLIDDINSRTVCMNNFVSGLVSIFSPYHKSQFYSELHTQYELVTNKLDKLVQFFKQVVEVLGVKKENVTNMLLMNELPNMHDYVTLYDDIIKESNSIIASHNDKSNNFQQRILDEKQEVKNYYLLENFAGYKEFIY